MFKNCGQQEENIIEAGVMVGFACCKIVNDGLRAPTTAVCAAKTYKKF
jgi:hypothetical protein